jgi:hypothetical protein
MRKGNRAARFGMYSKRIEDFLPTHGFRSSADHPFQAIKIREVVQLGFHRFLGRA